MRDFRKWVIKTNGIRVALPKITSITHNMTGHAVQVLIKLHLSMALLGVMVSSVALALDEADLSRQLLQIRQEKDMPGLRAAVRYPSGIELRASVGYADTEQKILLDDDIGMPGGSTGKMFVAALTMLLVEEGVLALDDSAVNWLHKSSWYQDLPNAKNMQVSHLLSHSSGLRDYPAKISFNSAMIWRVLRNDSAYFTPEELIGYVQDRTALFAAGEGYKYTDAGYLVLGRLIEAASDKPYYSLLQDRILQPLSLNQIRPQDVSIMTGVAIGYMAGARNVNDEGKMKFDPRSEWTGGGLITTPTMLVRFLSALAEGRIVSAKSLQRMLNSGYKDSQTPGWHYGFGLFVKHADHSFGHGGLWPGYRSHVKYYPATGISVAMQTNRDGRLETAEIVDRLHEAALKASEGSASKP